MFKIDAKKNIYLTRGDIATINVSAKNSDGFNYTFKVGDIVRINVFKKGGVNYVVLSKDTEVIEETTSVAIPLTSEDTKIEDLINKPVEYWYEIVLNPTTAPQTIVGYLEEPTIFKLLPEGGDNQ